MSLQACADIVAKGDPDRFRAAMATPVEARKVLFPLYAFNVEVARAPWVGSEPMIGEMRLQWWRDALEEITEGKPVRKHEVTIPLAEILDAQAATLLDQGVAARRWDLYKDPFEDEDHLLAYLTQTGGHLMWVAARALGAPDDTEDMVRPTGAAAALARFLMAVPELEARGRIPLVDGTANGIRALAIEALDTMLPMTTLCRALPKPARPAIFEAWQAAAILDQAHWTPERVASGTLGLSAFRKSVSLLRFSLG
ncbi:MAG: squalene/phytoene synthase family protein [Paracoccaceae bacterium]